MGVINDFRHLANSCHVHEFGFPKLARNTTKQYWSDELVMPILDSISDGLSRLNYIIILHIFMKGRKKK
jgi:hypothetical protein